MVKTANTLSLTGHKTGSVASAVTYSTVTSDKGVIRPTVITGELFTAFPTLSECRVCGRSAEATTFLVVGDEKNLYRSCRVCEKTRQDMGFTPTEFLLQREALLDDARRRWDDYARSHSVHGTHQGQARHYGLTDSLDNGLDNGLGYTEGAEEGDGYLPNLWGDDIDPVAAAKLDLLFKRLGLFTLCLFPMFADVFVLHDGFLRNGFAALFFLLGVIAFIAALPVVGKAEKAVIADARKGGPSQVPCERGGES